MLKLATRLLAAPALFLSTTLPAHAVVLQCKWRPGTDTSYSIHWDGTLDTQTAADAPVIWAGLPIEVTLESRSVARLRTLAVDANGSGTVLASIPSLTVQGDAVGQSGVLTLAAGHTRFSLNGKPLRNGPQFGGDAGALWLEQPPRALRVSPLGKVLGTVPLAYAADGQPSIAVAPPTTTPSTGPLVAAAGALDRMAFAQALVLQMIPALCPTRDVAPGDSWTALIPWLSFPLGAAALPPRTAAPATPLGKFTLTYTGPRTVAGRTLEQVHVDGAITLDPVKLAVVNAGLRRAQKDAALHAPEGSVNAATLGTTVLTAATQSVSGDFLFDAQAGQVASGQFALTSHTAGHSVTPAGLAGDDDWADFTGTLRLDRTPPPSPF